MSNEELIQYIQSSAPAACELEDCNDLQTAVERLVNFAWMAVNPLLRPSDSAEQKG